MYFFSLKNQIVYLIKGFYFEKLTGRTRFSMLAALVCQTLLPIFQKKRKSIVR